MPDTTITVLTPDAIDDTVRAHIAMQQVAYAHLADAGHAAALWDSFPERRDAFAADLKAQAAAQASGGEPTSRHLIARSARGAVVGVASAFEGVGDWELDLFGEAHVPAAAAWCLDTLYVMPEMRGEGLGQLLMDAVLPQHQDAYLWVIDGNAGALRFYERNGFRLDGFGGRSGPEWGDLLMHRMTRTAS